MRFPRARLAALAAAAGLTAATAVLSPTAASPAKPKPPAAFDAVPASMPRFGIQAPSVDPARQQHVVVAADGVELFVETWLPARIGDAVPPARVPVVVSISPYLSEGAVESAWALTTLVPRGYAYANVHVRGTGESGGCIGLFDATEADDSARAIEYLGRDAPFSDGNVGGYGISYPGGTILSAAGRGDPARVSYLKAIASGAPYHSAHEAQWTFDGVPSFLIPAMMPGNYFLQSMGLAFDALPTVPRKIEERPGCAAENAVAAVDWSGDHTPWHAERDNRAWTKNIIAATLVFHGHSDLTPMGGSPPSIERGLFDRLPSTTPKAGVFGVFGHYLPRNEHPEIADMIVAWFDRHLRGIDTGTESWPTVQVQGTDGRWRSEASWPTLGGPVGQLALGPGGALGASTPTGSTTYVEGTYETTSGFVPGGSAVFETAPLPARMELGGQPVADLWLQLAVPDAHVAARLEVVKPDGTRRPGAVTYGLRSARHLDPFTDGRFTQGTSKLAPVGVPVRVPVRFQPTDLVAQAGDRLRLTVAGSVIVNPGLAQLGVPESVFLGPSQPSGVAGPVRILHDCTHPSALRFELPTEASRSLVLGAPDADVPREALTHDGDGIS
ncbi:MAG TPA: CocE/NonD family hydrolase, partial [Acidimicrobiales bacterium]